MKKILNSVLLFTISFIAHSQNLVFTQTIKGTVIDEQSGSFLGNVSLVIETVSPSIAGMTDANGNFKLRKVPIGRQTIRASFVGYEEAVMSNVEVTSSHEVVLEIHLKEKIKKLDEVIINAGKQKYKAINEAAIVSARQLGVDQAVRYSGTRNDPSRMAQMSSLPITTDYLRAGGFQAIF